MSVVTLLRQSLDQKDGVLKIDFVRAGVRLHGRNAVSRHVILLGQRRHVAV